MGITNYDHGGFSSGGSEGVEINSGSVISTTPFANGEPFYARMIWKGQVLSNPFPDDNWISFGFRLRFVNSFPTEQRIFFRVRDDITGVPDFGFEIQSDGRVTLGNGFFLLIAEIELGRGYLFEVKYKRADSPDGELQIWVDSDLVLSLSGTDFRQGVNDLQLQWDNPEDTLPGSMHVEVNSFYMRSDDGANIDSIDARHGPYDIVGAYQGGPASISPNFGDNLDGGQWIHAADQPNDDATFPFYAFPVSTTKEGMVTFDDVRPGPFGDLKANGTPITIKHIWRARKSGASNIVLSGKYGSLAVDDPGHPNLDDTILVSFGNITTSFVNYIKVIDAPVGIYSRDIQMGFKGVRNAFGVGTRNLEVPLMTASILQRASRLVMIGGNVQRFKV